MGLSKRVRSYDLYASVAAAADKLVSWFSGWASPWSLSAAMAAWREMKAKMAISGVGSAEGHLPYTPTVPGSHRAGPCGPRGAPNGRTE